MSPQTADVCGLVTYLLTAMDDAWGWSLMLLCNVYVPLDATLSKEIPARQLSIHTRRLFLLSEWRKPPAVCILALLSRTGSLESPLPPTLAYMDIASKPRLTIVGRSVDDTANR